MNDPIKSIALTIAGEKQLAADKIARNRATFGEAPQLRKPSWIRVRIPPGNAVAQLKAKLRENRLVTVCEEASCRHHPRHAPALRGDHLGGPR